MSRERDEARDRRDERRARRGADGRRGRRGDDGGREQPMVPRAEFRSYYGRPVLKPPAWDWRVPAYLFTGGVSAGSFLLATGADLSARPALRRAATVSSLAALVASTGLLVADLGRPERFHHMLRVAKPTSPMSMGTWTLVAFAPGASLATANELLPRRVRRTPLGRLLRTLDRPGRLASTVAAPGVAAYTATLLSQTAAPAWHEAHAWLPFVFAGSAAAASGGLAMLLAPVDQAGPARRFAVAGAALELAAAGAMPARIGLAGEAYRTGRAHTLHRASTWLTAAGATTAALLGRRGRLAAGVAGLALLAGSAVQRFAVFEAGVASTKDPRYVVVPQRQRLARQAGGPAGPDASAGADGSAG